MHVYCTVCCMVFAAIELSMHINCTTALLRLLNCIGKYGSSMSALAEGHAIQKKLRSGKNSCSKDGEMVRVIINYRCIEINLEASYIITLSFQLRICTIVKSKKGIGYSKSGEFVEVQVSRTDCYDDVTRKAKEVVGLNGYEGEELALFRSDGTLIPNKEINNQAWTVGNYFRSIRKAASQVKLGVGFKKVMSFHCALNFKLASTIYNTCSESVLHPLMVMDQV